MNGTHQAIYDLAELCVRHGIQDAVICPGSRSAPLVLAFANHPGIKCRVVPDERSAAFIAMGIAQSTGRPTVLICTSGTAALQFAAAVAEAYHQHIPLLVMTADRPPEWIGQRDGQTIQQDHLYGGHVKGFFPVHTDGAPEAEWIANRNLNDAISLSRAYPPGPVHLNFPFREPLYPDPDTSISYGNPRVIGESYAQTTLPPSELKDLQRRLSRFKRILIAGGQPIAGQLPGRLDAQKRSIPILAELLSNLHGHVSAIRHADLVLDNIQDEQAEELRPDLLLTWGAGVVSKSVRRFLRRFPAAEHWHCQPSGPVADTYQRLTRILRMQPQDLMDLLAGFQPGIHQQAYFKRWRKAESIALKIRNVWLEGHLGEAGIVASLMKRLPSDCTLHLANSMSVRYGILAGLAPKQKNIRVFSNRGTSGIDGCSSTAVGHALSHRGPHVLITGDVAFLYDRNAFWLGHAIPNLHILVLQNHGGQIFQMIDGPRDRSEVKDYFVGPQPLDTRNLCREYGIRRLEARSGDQKGISEALNAFLAFESRMTLLEFRSEAGYDQGLWTELKNKIRKRHDHHT